MKKPDQKPSSPHLLMVQGSLREYETPIPLYSPETSDPLDINQRQIKALLMSMRRLVNFSKPGSSIPKVMVNGEKRTLERLLKEAEQDGISPDILSVLFEQQQDLIVLVDSIGGDESVLVPLLDIVTIIRGQVHVFVTEAISLAFSFLQKLSSFPNATITSVNNASIAFHHAVPLSQHAVDTWFEDSAEDWAALHRWVQRGIQQISDPHLHQSTEQEWNRIEPQRATVEYLQFSTEILHHMGYIDGLVSDVDELKKKMLELLPDSSPLCQVLQDLPISSRDKPTPQKAFRITPFDLRQRMLRFVDVSSSTTPFDEMLNDITTDLEYDDEDLMFDILGAHERSEFEDIKKCMDEKNVSELLSIVENSEETEPRRYIAYRALFHIAFDNSQLFTQEVQDRMQVLPSQEHQFSSRMLTEIWNDIPGDILKIKMLKR